MKQNYFFKTVCLLSMFLFGLLICPASLMAQDYLVKYVFEPAGEGIPDTYSIYIKTAASGTFSLKVGEDGAFADELLTSGGEKTYTGTLPADRTIILKIPTVGAMSIFGKDWVAGTAKLVDFYATRAITTNNVILAGNNFANKQLDFTNIQPKLTIKLDNCQLTAFPIFSDNTKNAITNLVFSISNNPAIPLFDFSGFNGLLKLTVSDCDLNNEKIILPDNNFKMDLLTIINNPLLTNIDISTLTGLKTLEIYNNNLTNITWPADISGLYTTKISLKNNRLGYQHFKVPAGKNLNDTYYLYFPQKDILISSSDGMSIDMSPYKYSSGNTVFTWKQKSGSTEITLTEGNDYQKSGDVFTFDISLGNKSVFCEITNDFFIGTTTQTPVIKTSPITFADPIAWNGATSTSWNTAANWTPNIVPAAGSNVIIPVVTTNYPTVSNATVRTITFEQGASVNLSGTLTAIEAVKVDYIIESGKWYAIGFPFNIETIYSHYFASEGWEPTLIAYDNDSQTGDFWLKEYDVTSSNLFEYTHMIEKNKGYIIQFPEWFNDTKITFISYANQVLNNNGTLSVAEHYQLVANPTLNGLVLSAEPAPSSNQEYYYRLNAATGATGKFERLVETTSIPPFEAIITIREEDSAKLSYSIGFGGTDVTALTPTPTLTNDPIIATHYYTLQGVKIQKPVENGIYLVKKIHASQKEEIVKTIYNKK